MHATRQAQYHQSCSGGDATRAWVAWLGGERKKLVFTHISSYVGGTSLLSTLKGWGQIVKLLQLVDSFLLSANQKPPFLL